MTHRRTGAAGRGQRRTGLYNVFVAGPRSKLVTVLGVLALAMLSLPLPAYAVTPLATEPRNRQQLSDPPGAVTLAFDRDIDPGVAKMIVSGPDGDNVTDGALIVEGNNVTSQLRDDLPRGTYTVHFRINRANGDPEGGAFQFSYGKGDFKTPADRSWSGEANEPAVLSGTNPNSSDEPDPPRSATATPGIQVTEESSSTDPAPPPTDPASTVQPPPGPPTDLSTSAGLPLSATATPAANQGGSSRPFFIAGLLVLVALVGGGLGVWRTRKGKSAPHE